MEKREETFRAEEIEIGFHPAGYRIDRTASPMDRYTQWAVNGAGIWRDPRPVCFHSLPEQGWRKVVFFE